MSKMILIGYKALEFYNKTIKETNGKFELLSLDEDDENHRFKLSSIINSKNITDNFIYNYCMLNSKYTMNTPKGEALVAPPEILKLIFLAEKDTEAAKLLMHINFTDHLNMILSKRLDELWSA